MTKRNGTARAIVTAVLTCAWAGGVQAAEGDWLVRVRALHMSPSNDNSTTTVVPALGEVTAEDRLFPEVDISYFFTPNIAAELILTVPQKHDVELGGVNIGSVKHLPPTLTLQYHFNPEGSVRPYAGLGLNYTRFSGVKLDAGTVLGGSVPLTMDRSSFGWAAQLGVDIRLAPQWFLNLDAKYVKIDADIAVKGAGVPVTRLDVDPLLLSVGLGYRF
ncbi:MAG: OmpW family protein [Methyloversatilis sp.]|nr:OmpW family protein [Methyloversatilis sp.]